MNTVPFSCEACGATVKAIIGQREATCKYCNRLQPVPGQTSAFVPYIPTDARIERLELENSVLRLEQELTNLDQRWYIEKRRYQVRWQRGMLRDPTGIWVAFRLSVGILSAFIGLALILSSQPAILGLASLFFGGGCMYQAVREADLIGKYEAAYQQHARRRATVSYELGQKKHLLKTLETRRRLERVVTRISDAYLPAQQSADNH